MMLLSRIVRSMVLVGCLISSAGCGQEGNEAQSAEADHLAPFERLIGGEWHLEGSYQSFSWGVGKRSVISENYFLVDGKRKKVAEGTWFWHPGEQKIRGYFTAINMPVVLFDYSTAFEGEVMRSELKSYSAEGREEIYLETWEFTGENSFEWSLYSRKDGAESKVMGGTYTRASDAPELER